MSQKTRPQPPGFRKVVQYTDDQPGTVNQNKRTTGNKTRKTKSNPIQIAFQQELKRFVGYVDRLQKPPTSALILEKEEESPARLSNTLFQLWNSYCQKLPHGYFAAKLISTGDYLFKVKEYAVAKQHCYSYYLRLLRENSSSEKFDEIYFPEGFTTESAIETCRAMFGNGLCTLKLATQSDPHLLEENTVKSLVSVLTEFRSLTQHLLPHESLCWLVYNGTVHIYNISTLLANKGYTKQVLQYLVWCCVCMESMIPLMTLKFLSWRGTLYTSVCYCYQDLKQLQSAEVFARRGLQKVHQLAKIEEQSLSEPTEESESIFREVTVKLSTVIFKRVVFESRRPKKIVHRPKTRQNLKELQLQPFPRTSTEKLVLDMFEGGAAQLLAVLEALTDTSRRICQPSPPTVDTSEGSDLMMDVWGELILAGYEIITRNGKSLVTTPLIDLARASSNEMPVQAVIRYLKLVFNYEYWDYYNLTLAFLLPLINELPEVPETLLVNNTVTLLDAMKSLVAMNKRVTRPSTCFAESVAEGSISPVQTSGTTNQPDNQSKIDELIFLADVLLNIKSEDTLFVQEQSDMLVDTALVLIHKLKEHYSKLVSTSTVKQFVIAEDREQMLHLLNTAHEVSLWLNLYSIDPLVPGELALKTALLYEGVASRQGGSGLFKSNSNSKKSKVILADGIFVIQQSLAAVEAVRSVIAIATTPQSDPLGMVVDPSLTKCYGEMPHSVTLADLQLEMVAVYQRLKLKIVEPNEQERVFEACNKNTLFLAIAHMQYANVLDKTQQSKQHTHLRESSILLQKAWTEERRLLAMCSPSEQTGNVPPPPLLKSRTSTAMTFEPAPFKPPPGKEVRWYRLFGRSSSGSNIKVRLNDTMYPGLATEVEAVPGCTLHVDGLDPNEKYHFAVAAFTAEGTLISNSIGESSKPVLATPPYSTLSAIGHLIQICHKTGALDTATEACTILWNFFVLPDSKEKKSETIAIPKSSFPRIHSRHIAGASITLVRHLIESILVSVDITVREGALFCDLTCDQGPLKSKQLSRLSLCEKLLVAIELSGRINDTQLGLQAIIQTYGLLAPLIHHNILCAPAVKVLLYCHAALTELPGVVKQRKCAGNIQHMTGVITFYLSKTLHQWGESSAATVLSENGHDLLAQFDMLYDELSEQSHAITPSNRKRPVKRTELPPNIKRGNVKDMIQESGGPPILKSDTLKAFEAHVLRHNAMYPTNASGEPEFTGQEDFNLLYTAVANMTAAHAQREVYKFRRRSRFLELYVRVLEKAMLESRPDLVIEWCSEAGAWLTRRNELLISPRVVGKGHDTKTKESKPEGTKQGQRGSDTNLIKAKNDPKGGNSKTVKKEGIKLKLLGAPDEGKIKAAELLRASLPDFWRRSYRLRRLRLITCEEMPWRAQLNLILGVSCYRQFCEKLELKLKTLEKREEGEYSQLPCEMFSVADVGSMLATEDREDSNDELRITQVPSAHLMELEREKTNLTNVNSKKGSTSSLNSRLSKFGMSSERGVKDSKLTHGIYLQRSFHYISCGMVLAHRGNHWALLQNIASYMWNNIMDLSFKTKGLSASTAEFVGLTEQYVNELTCRPMYFMAEFILDFVESIIGSNEDLKECSSLVGHPEDIEGGSSLHFDAPFDDTSHVHMRWIHRYVMEALQALHLNHLWEKLVHIGIRFNTLTNNVYADQTLPLIIYSKRKLLDRVAEYNEPWHTDTGSPSVHSTITPVQTGEHVSPQVVEALRLVSVPLELTSDLSTLSKVLGCRSHTALSLQYCRQLFLCYLAGFGKGALKQGTSPVSSFHPGTAITSKTYDKVTDLLVSPLPHSALSTVISSYEKTIEMLQVKGKTDLVIQAMNEQGNILFHSGNVKGALKWWCDALDTLLHVPNVLQNWHTFLDDGEALLAKCQIWGCLLGACITSNISQYVVYHSTDDRIDACLFSAALFKALFHASLPHPHTDTEYATYDIGDGFNIPSLIPGIDLLGDPFRCTGSTLLGSLHYVSETLLRHGYSVQALPVLSLYHYIALTLCNNSSHIILSRILKVWALCQLSLLSEAVKLWGIISQGEALPPPPCPHADNISGKTGNYIPVTAGSIMNVPIFDNTQPLNSVDNLKCIEHAIKSKLQPLTHEPFTHYLHTQTQLTHARLLTALACSTSVIPHQIAQEGSLEHTKHQLITAAEVTLIQLSKNADKEEAYYPELEISAAACEALAVLALQRQLGPTAAAFANQGLGVIQRAFAFERSDIRTYDQLCSKRRLDSMLWLQLKMRLVEGLSLMTPLYGSTDCQKMCLSTLEQSQIFNASEVNAWLSLKTHILDLSSKDGSAVEKATLKELSKLVIPSCLGAQVSVGAVLYSATNSSDNQLINDRLEKAMKLLDYQSQLYYAGKPNVHSYISPVSAKLVLFQSEIQISKICDLISQSQDPVPLLSIVEEVISRALLNPCIEQSIRVELLIRLGCVLRSLWEHNSDKDSSVLIINTLCDCIVEATNNIAVTKEAFLELGLLTATMLQSIGESDNPKHNSLEKRAAWSSIRGAALCNVATNTISSLAQKPTSQKNIDPKVLKKLPAFAALELNRDLSKKLLEPDCKISHPTPPPSLSWVKLLSYLETLKRDQQTQGFSGYCPMGSPGLACRVAHLQEFLSQNMPGWTTQCNAPRVSRNITYLTVGRTRSTPSSRESSSKSTESVAADTAPEGCMTLQWFTPRIPSTLQTSANQTLLLFALNHRPVKTSSPMFSGNSFLGVKVISCEAIRQIQNLTEYAYTHVCAQEEVKKHTILARRPSTKTSTATDAPITAISPEPFKPSDVQLNIVSTVSDLMGLDAGVSKEMAYSQEVFSAAAVAQLETVFSLQNSIPQSNPELARWLISCKKVIQVQPEKAPVTPPAEIHLDKDTYGLK